jgi:hypothetical protein
MIFDFSSVIQGIVLGQKILIGIITIIYCVDAFLQFKKTRLKQTWLLFLFFSYYLFYITLNIISFFLIGHLRLAGLGISIFGLTFGNLALYRFSMHIFYPGDYKHSVLVISKYRVHLIIGLFSSFIYVVTPFIYDGYEESGKSIPIYLLFLSLPLFFSYLGVYLGQFIQINKVEKRINQLNENQLSEEKRKIFHFKVVRMKTSSIIFSFTVICVYIDSFSPIRTLFAVLGWLFMGLGITIVHYNLHMRFAPKTTG